MNTIKYDEREVEFFNLENGGVDNAIRQGIFPMDTSERSLIQKFYIPKETVYDIGAYIGTHSILFALKGSEVISLEPSFNNYRRAIINCKDFTDIKLFNCGLHNKDYICRTPFKDCNSINEEESVQFIQYIRLENIIKKYKLPNPQFIKLDIEGMESIVLEDMKGILEKIRPTLFIELHVAPRNSLNNGDFPDNPHWRYPDQGGFDFNEFKKYKYLLYDINKQKYNISKDFNPKPGTHECIIAIPEEK